MGSPARGVGHSPGRAEPGPVEWGRLPTPGQPISSPELTLKRAAPGEDRIRLPGTVPAPLPPPADPGRLGSEGTTLGAYVGSYTHLDSPLQAAQSPSSLSPAVWAPGAPARPTVKADPPRIHVTSLARPAKSPRLPDPEPPVAACGTGPVSSWVHVNQADADPLSVRALGAGSGVVAGPTAAEARTWAEARSEGAPAPRPGASHRGP